MWYIMEVPWFFFSQVLVTTLILAVVSFSIPPFINWLEGKLDKGE